MSIEGVPEGWELVRIGCLNDGEWAIGGDGKPWQFKASLDHHRGTEHWPIICKVSPVCTWPHGVFADGWIAENQDGYQYWYDQYPLRGSVCWVECPVGVWSNRISLQVFCNPPVFRSDLPWDKRIQQVGPTIEATLTGGSK